MPRRTRQRITVPLEFDRWIDGLEDFDPTPEIIDEWDGAMDRLYGVSQETVHVITNDLRSSGRYTPPEDDGNGRVSSELIYGGDGKCDYAIYEHQRGAPHDWITQAFARTRPGFEQALADGINSHIRTFL